MSTFRALCLLSSIVFLSVCASHRLANQPEPPPSATQVTGFIQLSSVTDEAKFPCLLYVPRDYDRSKRWPLIVFLHGMGDRGDDGLRPLRHGIAKAVMDNPDRFPALVVMPQCPSDSAWGAGHPQWNDASSRIDSAIDLVLSQYSIDEDRISLTGASMGGFGTFAYGARNIERFSALMPICGGGKITDAPQLAKRPIRVFHGAEDKIVRPEKSREMVEAIRAAGGDIEYTEYPNIGHKAWDKAYSEEGVIEWLINQRRP